MHKNLAATPQSLFYYYESTRKPFLSISELESHEFAELMNDLSNVNTPENRFDEAWKRDFYLTFRPYTERTIRERFIDKGGEPKATTPRYFSLGPTKWFLDWYENPAHIEIPLDTIPSSSISFTYPDSMTSLLIAEDHFEPFRRYKRPYHGEVFRLEELAGLIAEHGLPDEDDPENQSWGNRIVEAQVWDLDLLAPYIDAAAPDN